MRNIDKKTNILKANILAENLYLSSKSYVDETDSETPKIIGDEGKKKYIAEKMRRIELLLQDKKNIENEINTLKKEIDEYTQKISPNQLEMF